MARKLFRYLHRWLGLTTGLIVFIVSVTGCIYVFSDELKGLFYGKRLFIVEQEAAFLPLSVLKDNAQRALDPSHPITRCDVFPKGNRSWIFRAAKTKPGAIGYWNYYPYYYRVYVNPYNGEIVHIENSKWEFFQVVLSLHMNLLLGERIGKPLVGYAVVGFLFILISGVVLWWPRKWKKKKLRQRFAIKWKGSVKRVTYDLHNVPGFYILIPVFIIATTGLVFSFNWADQAVQYLFNGGTPAMKRTLPVSAPSAQYADSALDTAVRSVMHAHTGADMLSIRFRAGETSPIDIQTRLRKSRTSTFVWYYFDRNDGRLLTKYGHRDITGGEKVRSMNYDLHVGSIGGTATKILACFCSLICASLPVTGFLIWYNKRRKRGIARVGA
ncbi:PepSY-associated TM helix domain-containing protein [Parapedobacter tibetensis]|uniref:PepSY-associated TM helix domain-containing protein n=1 Tax=Parapedobacter tibetensis TaxID=2972951 RepID=UPI00214DC048|nr:PepSY-associated TM helix domain-containing protein [Parapedobacter tibetensis]